MVAGRGCCRDVSTVLITVIAVVICLQPQMSHAATTPEYILPCKRTDTKINRCLKDAFNHLQKYLIDGIPEIDVPVMDPFHIEAMALNNWNGPVKIRGAFNNLTAYGPANYTVDSVKADLKKYIFDMVLHLPHIEVKGKYNITAQVVGIPIKSKGVFWAAFYNIKASLKVYGKEVMLNGQRFMKTDKLGCDFDLGKANFKINDTNFVGVLGEMMNQVVNQNSAEIVREMKPIASTVISSHFKMFLNRVYMKVPIPVWLPD